MKLKAIVFDKDGTLLDYIPFWKPLTEAVVEELMKKYGVEGVSVDYCMSRLGIDGERLDISKPLPRGAHREIGDLLYSLFGLAESNVDKDSFFVEAITSFTPELKLRGRVEPTCENLRETIEKLKDEGYFIALMTSDDMDGAVLCLDKLGVSDLFDEVVAYDGEHPAKPNPYFMNAFLERHGFDKSEVVMVGDTESDVQFAKNAGVYMLGVAKEEGNRRILLSLGADACLPTVSYISEWLDLQG